MIYWIYDNMKHFFDNKANSLVLCFRRLMNRHGFFWAGRHGFLGSHGFLAGKHGFLGRHGDLPLHHSTILNVGADLCVCPKKPLPTLTKKTVSTHNGRTHRFAPTSFHHTKCRGMPQCLPNNRRFCRGRPVCLP